MNLEALRRAEEAQHAARFRTFAAWLAPLCALFAAFYAAAALAMHDARFGWASGLTLVLGGACFAGAGLARRGRLAAGAVTLGGTLSLVAVVFSLVLPQFVTPLVLMPLSAVALVLPYTEGPRLRAFIVAAFCCSLTCAVVGLWREGRPAVLPLVERALVLGALVVALFLLLLLLWQYSSRQKAVLAEARAADARKGEFLAVLAHELRNPLASIRAAAEVLARLSPVDPGARGQGELIERESAHVARLLEDVLDQARVARGELVLRREPTRVVDLLARAAELARSYLEARGQRLHVDAGPDGLGLDGDPVRLTQVLANLLHNASKYSPDGSEVWLAARRDGERVLFEVRDQGEGLARESLERIWEPFVQGDASLARAHGGLGLGLALVKRLVALHGGEVGARSAGPGQGSTFWVRLPALPHALAAPAPAPAPPPPPGARAAGRVLVVDDNVNAARSLALLIRLWGFEVEVAHDGPSALARARDFAPTHVVLDIGLPHMDGYEVARRLRAEVLRAPARLIALSGYGQDEHRERAREAGFAEHFVKPVAPDALAHALSAER